MSAFFKPIQSDILCYKEELDKHNIVFDKTNQTFLNLNLKILDFLSSEDAIKLDEWCEYNHETMGDEFIEIIQDKIVNEKSQGILMMFFLRIAIEMQLKYGTIQNDSLSELYKIMHSKEYKYPDYISAQRYFANDRMPEIIKRRYSLG